MSKSILKSESRVQSEIRLAAARKGMHLFRNNVGVLPDKRGVPLRFGLANESAAQNAKIKSADLIGWQTVTITPDMVGKRVAVFASVECKKEEWTDKGDPHTEAQKTWKQLVEDSGGIAVIINDPDDI